jgi:hypothetical protein
MVQVAISVRGQTIPQLSAQHIAHASGLVSRYIIAQHDEYLEWCAPLSPEQRAAMNGFFSAHLLDGVRVSHLYGFRVANPAFYPLLAGMGFANLPDFSQMTAITFSDVVVSHVPFTNELLFHELVHVEQYRQLGTPQFSNLYVLGFLTGGGYEGIPLERNAYALGARFEANPRQRFSVADEVSEWVRNGRF